MRLGRLIIAFLLLLAAVDIVLLAWSLRPEPEVRGPAIGQASLQRIEDMNGEARTQEQALTAGATCGSPTVTKPRAGQPAPKPND